MTVPVTRTTTAARLVIPLAELSTRDSWVDDTMPSFFLTNTHIEASLPGLAPVLDQPVDDEDDPDAPEQQGDGDKLPGLGVQVLRTGPQADVQARPGQVAPA